MARKSRKNKETFLLSQTPHMKVWWAGLYIRLSVEDNGSRGDSLETQQQIMEAHLALCPDIEVVEVYIDNGVSGQTFERPSFQRLLADVEAGKINCVAVKDLSRLGRSAIDSGYYVEKYFPLHGVRFLAINDQYDSEDENNGTGQIALPLKNLMNEAYALDISRKVRAQQHQAMRAGEFIGSRPPYGYRKDPANCHRLLVNTDTAPVVRQIFRWAADGVALNAIVKKLNEASVPTPSHYLASIGLISNNKIMGSGKWQTRTVGKILADEVYVGDMVQGKTRSVKRKQVPTDPADWIVIRDTHEPLVSRELFQKAQNVRAQAAQKYAKTEKLSFSPNIFKGRIFCGHCGKSLHRQRSHDRYFFRCISNDRIRKGSCPGDIRVLPEDELISVILDIIQKQASIIINNGCWSKRNGKVAEQSAAIGKEIARLQQETERDRKYLISLYEHFVSGVLSKTEYTELKTGYEQKIKAATSRSQQLLEQNRSLERDLNDYIELSDRLASLKGDITLTGDLIGRLVERIVVYDEQNISVHFKFRDEFGKVVQE
ncbi:recombinase family protein [Oscillospiraceae bacterium 50-16]